MHFIGWYGKNNCGDEAFKDAFRAIFPGDHTFGDSEVPGATNVLGGGDVIKPYYLDKIKGPFHIIGAGLGYESEIELLKSKPVQKVYLRNLKDVALAREHGLDAHYTPDIVFSLQPLYKDLPEQKTALVILNDAINPRPGMSSGDMAYAQYFKWEMAKSLNELSKYYHLVFLPFSKNRFNMDSKIHAEVLALMGETEASVIEEPLRPMDALNLIADAHLVITMKFHGCIFSTIAGTPFVNVGLSRKTDLYCKEQHLSGCSIAPYTFTYDRFMEAIKVAESTHSDALFAIAEDKRKILDITFRDIKLSL